MLRMLKMLLLNLYDMHLSVFFFSSDIATSAELHSVHVLVITSAALHSVHVLLIASAALHSVHVLVK